jgi:hypothetical protein
MLQARKGKNQTSTPGHERQMVVGVKTRVLGGKGTESSMNKTNHLFIIFSGPKQALACCKV